MAMSGMMSVGEDRRWESLKPAVYLLYSSLMSSSSVKNVPKVPVDEVPDDNLCRQSSSRSPQPLEAPPAGTSPSTARAGLSTSLDMAIREARHPCPIQRLPDDLLREIFMACCFDKDGNHEALLALCAVDWHWRSTAIAQFTLWSKIPAIELEEFDRAKVARAYNCLHLYLNRSGALPVSFTVSIPHVFLHAFPPIRALMQLLVDHSSRWGVVDLVVPYAICETLSPIKGRLPELTILKLTFKTDVFDPQLPTNIDMFSQAPKLRSVDFVTWQQRDMDTVFMQLASIMHIAGMNQEDPDLQWLGAEFPTEELERLSISELKDSKVYQELLAKPPQGLKSLEISVGQGLHVPLFSTPVVLPGLTALALTAHKYHGALSSHLDSMTLPVLQELTIRGFQDPLDSFATPVLVNPDVIARLLHRSGCSLRHLSVPFPAGVLDDLEKILSFSPDLESLDINLPEEAAANALIFDATAPSPVLPKLKTLRLRCRDIFGDDLPNDSSISALVKVIKSRSFDLQGSDGPKQTLEKVEFTGWFDQTSLYYWLLLRPPMLELIGELSELARQEEEYSASFWKLAKTYSNFYLRHPRFFLNWILWGKMAGMHKYLRKLERLDLERFDTHALTFYGVVRLIHELGKAGSGDAPGDHLGRFRTRARRLEEKWKPYLLRDARKFWWVHHGTGLSLHWPVSDNSRENEDDVYNSIVGLKPKASFSHVD